MKRKRFLGSLLGSPLLAATSFQTDYRQKTRISNEIPWRIPPYLKTGDTIGITCPAGFMTMSEIQPPVEIMKSWGFNLRIEQDCRKRDFIFRYGYRTIGRPAANAG
jgi:muramoyltetrapeptide carboxypeptidase